MLKKEDLHNYQVRVVNHIINHPFCGVFLDMGLGKTTSTLTATDYLMYEDLDVMTALVIAPKRVAEHVWDAEINKWEHLKHLRISKVMGTPKKREEALRAEADIYVIGRDNVAWLCGLYGGSMLPFDMLIIDESSSFKSHKSMRFKALKMVQPSFKRVVILTGTPSPNGLIDLWPQLYLLDRGDRLGKTITKYREEYFKPGHSNGHVVYNYNIQKNGEERIHEKIKDICISMSAKDYLDLPKRNDNYIELEFTEKLKKKYKDFEREKVLELMESIGEDKLDNYISAVNAAALSNKLLQFSNGAVYDEDRNVHHMHDIKLDALEEIIENANGQPVLVAYSFRHDIDRILERLKKYKPVKLNSNEDIENWNKGKVPVLVMHPASGGHGLNLQYGGNIIVWFGLNWSLELYMQLNARLHRQNQEKPVFIHHLMMKGTIDMEVMKALQRKDHKQQGLMEAVKARIMKYKKEFNG
jgi:SNF2 family DNA or RNA helicase